MSDLQHDRPGDQGSPAIEELPASSGSAATGVLPSRDANAAATARPTRRRFGEGALIACDNLVRIYKVADLEVVALQGLDLLVDAGEMMAIVGASGSGKSTLLNILGGLDTPSAGRAVVAGHDLGQMGRRERTLYRRRSSA